MSCRTRRAPRPLPFGGTCIAVNRSPTATSAPTGSAPAGPTGCRSDPSGRTSRSAPDTESAGRMRHQTGLHASGSWAGARTATVARVATLYSRTGAPVADGALTSQGHADIAHRPTVGRPAASVAVNIQKSRSRVPSRPWNRPARSTGSDCSTRLRPALTRTRDTCRPSALSAVPSEVAGSRIRFGWYRDPSSSTAGIGNGRAAGHTDCSVGRPGGAALRVRCGGGSRRSTATSTRAAVTATPAYQPRGSPTDSTMARRSGSGPAVPSAVAQLGRLVEDLRPWRDELAVDGTVHGGRRERCDLAAVLEGQFDTEVAFQRAVDGGRVAQVKVDSLAGGTKPVARCGVDRAPHAFQDGGVPRFQVCDRSGVALFGR